MFFTRALIEHFVPTKPDLTDWERAHIVEETKQFIDVSLSQTYLHFRIGITGLTVFLHIWLMINRLRRVPGDRAIETFENLMPLTAMLTRFFRSMSAMVFFESAPVLRALNVEDLAVRQQIFRARRAALLARGDKA